MTSEVNWSNIEVEHVRPICLFDISKNEKLRKAFNWINTQPLSEENHQQKRTKYNFFELNEE